MRVLLLTDNFVPETNSPALRAYEHAKAWVDAGVPVTVVTTIPNFPTGKPLPPYRNRLYQRESVEGINVVRVWSLLAPNSGIALRSLDFLSFAATGFVAGLFQEADVIVATSPQMLTGLAGWWLGAARRKPWVLEVRDLWPDSIISVGVMQENLFIRLLRRLEHRLYRHAARVVAVSSGIKDRLIARGVPAAKVGVVPNGVNCRRMADAKETAAAREIPPSSGRFTAAYVGTHGMAQGLETVLQAANLLRDNDVHFNFVGDGARRQAMVALAGQMGLKNVSFAGLVPLAAAAEYLHASDVVLIPLKRTDQIEITLPGKIFEAAAAGKPMIVSAEGASADLILRYEAGLVVSPENPPALAAAIRRLQKDAGLREKLAQGSLALARDFDREHFARDMLIELQRAIAAGLP
jgi:glycosyltransferase involved in cell wall biosynthesis